MDLFIISLARLFVQLALTAVLKTYVAQIAFAQVSKRRDYVMKNRPDLLETISQQPLITSKDRFSCAIFEICNNAKLVNGII